MTLEQIRKAIMASESKPAIKSKSLWGSALAFIGLGAEILNTVAASGVVPPHTGLVLVLIGNLLSVFGRLSPEIKPIEGFVVQK